MDRQAELLGVLQQQQAAFRSAFGFADWRRACEVRLGAVGRPYSAVSVAGATWSEPPGQRLKTLLWEPSMMWTVIQTLHPPYAALWPWHSLAV